LDFLERFPKKYLYTKFHENPSGWSRVAPCEQTDGQTDITKLTGAVRNFANSPKNDCVIQNPDSIVLYHTVLYIYYKFFPTPLVPAPFNLLPLVIWISMSVSIIVLKTKLNNYL
jgi:hypothetical protein